MARSDSAKRFISYGPHFAPRKRCIFLLCETCVKDYIIRLTNYIDNAMIYPKEAQL